MPGVICKTADPLILQVHKIYMETMTLVMVSKNLFTEICLKEVIMNHTTHARSARFLPELFFFFSIFIFIYVFNFL